jgi:hypothetical protein
MTSGGVGARAAPGLGADVGIGMLGPVHGLREDLLGLRLRIGAAGGTLLRQQLRALVNGVGRQLGHESLIPKQSMVGTRRSS